MTVPLLRSFESEAQATGRLGHFTAQLPRRRGVTCGPEVAASETASLLRHRARDDGIASGQKPEQPSESYLQNSCGDKIQAAHLANADSVVVSECWV